MSTPAETAQLRPIIAAWCDRCGAPYLPLTSITGCPWHDSNYAPPIIIPMDTCGCGRPKRAAWRSCGHCRAAKRSKPGSRWGVYCACGAVKKAGVTACRECRTRAGQVR